MPWLATDPMIERLEIVQNAFSDCSTMADVCVRYGARVALLTTNGTHATRIGDDRRPLHEPRIQMRPRVKALAGERIAHHVLHARFDFTYGLRPIQLACHRPHAKVATEVGVGRMPVDRLQRMHQHDRLRVVDEDRIGDATEVTKPTCACAPGAVSYRTVAADGVAVWRSGTTARRTTITEPGKPRSLSSQNRTVSL